MIFILKGVCLFLLWGGGGGKLHLIPAKTHCDSRFSNWRTWFQRMMQESFSCRFHIYFYSFFTAVIILLLSNVLMVLFSDRIPFSLAKTITVPNIVFSLSLVDVLLSSKADITFHTR